MASWWRRTSINANLSWLTR